MMRCAAAHVAPRPDFSLQLIRTGDEPENSGMDASLMARLKELEDEGLVVDPEFLKEEEPLLRPPV